MTAQLYEHMKARAISLIHPQTLLAFNEKDLSPLHATYILGGCISLSLYTGCGGEADSFGCTEHVPGE